MVTHSFYESDNRVHAYAEALAAEEITSTSWRFAPLRRSCRTAKTIEGVNVYRLQNRSRQN